MIALRRFLPEAEIDVLLEEHVGSVLAGFDDINIIGLPTKRTVMVSGKTAPIKDRLMMRGAYLWLLREREYDVAFNLHGGTTATFFTFLSGARHRVGYKEYQYSFLYNHLLSSSADFWGRFPTHSVEQQLALLGSVGVPVADRPKTHLPVEPWHLDLLERKFLAATGTALDEFGDFALMHPAAAFDTKRWATENFARTAEYLYEKGFGAVAVSDKNDRGILERLRSEAKVPLTVFDDLSLGEIVALASRAKLFVGNDSGIAHIAAAVKTPSVVIFGSSNINHWRPWTDAPNEVVYEPFACQPCAGYRCKEFGEPRCIQSVGLDAVTAAIGRVMRAMSEKGEPDGPPLSFVGGT